MTEQTQAGLPPEAASAPAGGRGGLPTSVLAVAGGIVALIVIAIVVALALPDQPTEYAAGSPEAAFQDFYDAFEENDAERAYAALSTSAKALVTPSDYRRMFSDHSWQRSDDRRLVLLRSEVKSDRATLTLRVDHFSEGGLTGNRYTEERTIPLVREDGAWRIDEALVGIESVAYKY